MNVLSLFDGMSCGQIALNRLGVRVDNYYAAEIDKYAIQVTQANFPNTIQLGSVCDIKAKDLPKIDLILAGSPCQGFSFAGKQLAFDDPRSALFFEFIRLLKECNPKYFLLENVRMKREYLEIITEQVSQCYSGQGNDLFDSRIEPILINSALVSAQSRQRYYWTNISNIGQPEERNIVLRDILEICNLEKYNLSYKGNKRAKDNPRSRAFKTNQKKSGALLANQYKQSTDSLYALVANKPIQIGTAADINGHDILKRVYSPDGKSPTLNACSGGNREPKVITGGAFSKDRINKFKETLKDNPQPSLNGIIQLNNPSHSSGRVYSPEGKSPTLMAGNSGGGKEPVKINDDIYWRKLTPLECERLQTVPDNYTNHVSNTQRYKMLDNGWTIDVICHILKNIEVSLLEENKESL